MGRWTIASRGNDVTGSGLAISEETEDDAVHGANADLEKMKFNDIR